MRGPRHASRDLQIISLSGDFLYEPCASLLCGRCHNVVGCPAAWEEREREKHTIYEPQLFCFAINLWEIKEKHLKLGKCCYEELRTILNESLV